MKTTDCLVVGCGYLGERVANRWRDRGATVTVVTRSSQRAQGLAAKGFQALLADILKPESLVLPPASQVLFAVGHDRSSGFAIEQVFEQGLKNVLNALTASPERLIYISSTGVYGQVDAEEVTEASPCQPTREGGRACLAAEAILQSSEFAAAGIILRLAGLYGPGRIPRVAEILGGQSIAAPAEGFINLIHVDDAARIVVAAADQLEPPRLYVVSDGHAVKRSDYYAELARLVGAPGPSFVAPNPAAHVALRAGSDKRVSPQKLFADLALALEYPTYKEGLAAIVREMRLAGE